MKISCVYSITNSTNGKRYIGSAQDWRVRKTGHLRQLRAGNHHSVALQRAWNKHGEAAFSFSPIIVCSGKDLLFYEQRAIDGYDSVRCGYNIAKVAGSPMRGRKQPESARKRISEVNKLRWANYTLEQREAIAKKQRGKQWSAEARAKVSRANKGRIHTGQALENIRAARPHIKNTAEQKAKISAALKGRPTSGAHRAALSKALKGRTFTDETRAKMSASAKARHEREQSAHDATQRARVVHYMMGRHGIA